MGLRAGLSQEQMLSLPDFETSPLFDSEQKLVVRFAKATSETPSRPRDELFAELQRHFTEPQLVELASAIAWENYRARFNRAFDIEAAGFTDIEHGQTADLRS